MAGCYGNSSIDTYFEKQLDKWLDDNDDHDEEENEDEEE